MNAQAAVTVSGGEDCPPRPLTQATYPPPQPLTLGSLQQSAVPQWSRHEPRSADRSWPSVKCTAQISLNFATVRRSALPLISECTSAVQGTGRAN
ncbi:hypothetical protein ACOMHN_050461 [Nucella lapillus]